VQRRLALLALPFLAVVLLARWAVPAWGDWIARHAANAAAWVAPLRPPKKEEAPAPAPPPSVDRTDVPDAGDDSGAPDGGAPLVARPVARAPSAAAVPKAPTSVHVPAALVQKAIDDGGRSIRARTVRGPDRRPAGVRLTGVSGLGIGLRDGDVIVAVDGKPALDEDACTSAALSAVARGDSTLRATIERDGVPFDCAVDLPLAPELPGKAR
jgi:S1-C subfamily serine protease